jgi:hypothetical protein
MRLVNTFFTISGQTTAYGRPLAMMQGALVSQIWLHKEVFFSATGWPQLFAQCAGLRRRFRAAGPWATR